MAKAFVLIETNVGKTKEVANTIRGIPGVKTVDAVTGPYDIVVVIEAKDLNSIGDIVTSKIHPISGISRTVTCLTI